jgi:hypothetical protein
MSMQDPEYAFKTVSAKVGCFLLVLILSLCLAPMYPSAAQSPSDPAQTPQPGAEELHPLIPFGVRDRLTHGRDRQPTPEPLQAVIVPEQLTVHQGEPARFESRSTPREGLSESWSGPENQQAAGSSFEVRTEDLAPGRYGVSLSVTNSREQRARARAILVVTAKPVPPEQPGGNGDAGTDEPHEYSARIATDTQQARQSQPVTFTVELIPGRRDARFRFHFGDGTSEETRAGYATHAYEAGGTFEAYVDVLGRGDEVIAESNHIAIAIHESASPGGGGTPPPPPNHTWLWTGIALLAGIGAGYLLFARRKETVDTGTAPRFRAVPKSDKGIQDIDGGTLQTMGPEVSFAPVADIGLQEITTGQEPVIREERWEND